MIRTAAEREQYKALAPLIRACEDVIKDWRREARALNPGESLGLDDPDAIRADVIRGAAAELEAALLRWR